LSSAQYDTRVVNLRDICIVALPASASMAMDPTAHRESDAGTAGVVARPTLLFPAALAVGFVLDHVLRLPFPIMRTSSLHWISAILAGLLILIGVAIFVAGARGFRGAATPLPTNQPARALVTSGIYRWTRNPIYLAFFLVYCGIGLVVRSPWILILVLPLAIAIRYGVVAREEAYLEQRFGDAYRNYKASVRRWF
jgi:protein-S-isoprenylcysteine O-methyltransferase Ste14